MYLQQVLSMYDYHVWASVKTLLHLKHLSLHDDLAHSFIPKILKVFKYIYIRDAGWLATIKGENQNDVMSFTEKIVLEDKHDDFEILEEKMEKLAEQFRLILSEQPEKKIMFMNMKFSYTDIVQHLMNHGTYRRGQITAMLKQMNYPNTQTDYMLYLYLVNREQEELNIN